jgi:hypothetical protein
MSDPRYPDPANGPNRNDRRDPMPPKTPRDDVTDDGRSGTWAWIVGIIAVIVIAMLVYDYNRPISTASSPPANPPTTTGFAPAPASPPAPALQLPPVPAPKAP